MMTSRISSWSPETQRVRWGGGEHAFEKVVERKSERHFPKSNPAILVCERGVGKQPYWDSATRCKLFTSVPPCEWRRSARLRTERLGFCSRHRVRTDSAAHPSCHIKSVRRNTHYSHSCQDVLYIDTNSCVICVSNCWTDQKEGFNYKYRCWYQEILWCVDFPHTASLPLKL
jgi:hypothetical protein